MLFVCGASVVSAAEDADLTKAKTLFEEVYAKQKDTLKAAFEREIAKITRTGNLTQVKEIKGEQTAFTNEGRLPDSDVMKSHVQKFEKAVKVARDRLEAAYERKVAALTRAEKLDDAKAIQKEFTSYLAKLDLGVDPNDPQPENEPAPPDDPAASEEQAITVTRAVWKQDGIAGTPGDQEFEATEVFQRLLFSRGTCEINRTNFGNLDGRPASRSLFLEMMIFRVPVHLQLTEGSSIVLGELTPIDRQKPGFRMGNTRLELYEVIWQTADGSNQVDVTEDIVPLLRKAPVKASPPAFREIGADQKKQAIFRFRTGPQTLEIVAAQSSVLVVPMNAAVKYEVPWNWGAAATRVQIRMNQAIWKHDGRIGKVGDQESDVRSRISAMLQSRQSVMFDTATLGELEPAKSSKSLSLDMLVNGVHLDLQLTEGSRISLQNATDKELESPGIPLGSHPVVIQDFLYQTIEDGESSANEERINTLLKGECAITEPLFEDFAPGKKKLANLRLRIGQRILKIGAAQNSVLKLDVE